MNVLIIDDSMSVRMYHRHILESINAVVIKEAENGAEGLEKSDNVDLVLVDINMPVMDGYSFVEEFRKNNKNAYIIMISTESEKKDIEKALSIGVDLYLTKPIKPEDLKYYVGVFNG